MKHSSVLCLFTCLLVFAGCFQPVDIGKTYVEKASAHLRVTNASVDEDYILEGLELRNAEGSAAWENLNLSKGQTWEVHTETAGTFTLWYRVRDAWFSASEVNACDGGQVEIALNKSHDLLFKGEELDVTRQDSDGDGYPDVWERENGFNPEDPADGGRVYVSANGRDELEHGNGTPSRPYKTLAKAADKASRGLSPEIRIVVVLGTLDGQGGNDQNPENPARADSVFFLGKTRNPVTILGKDPLNPGGPSGALTVAQLPSDRRRILYLGPGADIALQDISIRGGRGKGGGIFVSSATLTLKSGAVVENNNASPGDDLTGIVGGGIYMENGRLVMEAGSSVRGNKADNTAGLRLFASRFTMNGGTITANHANLSSGGMAAENSTVKMFNGAEISGNSAGAADMAFRAMAGGVVIGSSELTMHAGSKIGGNTVYGWAGGIYVAGESTLIMEDGEISGNECIKLAGGPSNNGWGGGVVLSDRASFIMKGGAIKGNTAGEYGGGIFLTTVASSFTMSGGTVYGYSVGDTNSNKIKTLTPYKGHAIYDYRTIHKPYDGTVTRFPE
jgi:hypothetical protein